MHYYYHNHHHRGGTLHKFSGYYALEVRSLSPGRGTDFLFAITSRESLEPILSRNQWVPDRPILWGKAAKAWSWSLV